MPVTAGLPLVALMTAGLPLVALMTAGLPLVALMGLPLVALTGQVFIARDIPRGVSARSHGSLA